MSVSLLMSGPQLIADLDSNNKTLVVVGMHHGDCACRIVQANNYTSLEGKNGEAEREKAGTNK